MLVAIPKTQVQALTLERLHAVLDPHRVYYRPVVFDILKNGHIAEIEALAKGAQELKDEYKDFDGLIDAAHVALRNARAT